MSAAAEGWMAMGGYAAYVWPAYGFAFFVMLWIAVSSHMKLKRARRELEKLDSRSGKGYGQA